MTNAKTQPPGAGAALHQAAHKDIPSHYRMTFSHRTACAMTFCRYNSKPLPLNDPIPDTLSLCVLFGAGSLGQGMCSICLSAEPSKVQAADVTELLFAHNRRPTGHHI